MTFPKIKKHLTQSGDTLIEVMVVLTVLGFAIAISYATANRGLLNVRQAEENSSATEKVQSQVENLRALLASSTNDKSNLPAFNDPKNIFGPTTAFCIPDVNATPTIITPSASVDASVPNDLSTPCSFGSSTDFPARILIYNCDFDTTANSPCAGLTGPDTFVVKATWEDVAGDGVDSSTQIYRLHPPTVVSAAPALRLRRRPTLAHPAEPNKGGVLVILMAAAMHQKAYLPSSSDT